MMSEKEINELLKVYDVSLEIDENLDLTGWEVIFNRVGNEFNSLDLLCITGEQMAVIKFNEDRWLDEFRVTWTRRGNKIWFMVDENCPEMYKIDTSEIEEVIDFIKSSGFDIYKKVDSTLESTIGYYNTLYSFGLDDSVTTNTVNSGLSYDPSWTTTTYTNPSSDWLNSIKVQGSLDSWSTTLGIDDSLIDKGN